MSWFKIDDKSAFHRKIVDAGNEAWGALCRAGAWSADHLTDGRVPWSVALTIAPKKIWDRLFAVRLCDALDGRGEFQIHDYLDWNPDREQVLTLREQRRESGRRGGQANRQAKAKQVLSKASSNGSSKSEAKPNPVPVPVPVPKEEESTPHTRALPEAGRIEAEIARHAVFASLNAAGLAESHAGFMMTAPQKLDWVIRAIDDCAAAHSSLGLTAPELQRKLVGYMRHAKRPKPLEPVAVPASKPIRSDDDDDEREAALKKARDEGDARVAARLERELVAKEKG